MKASEFLQTKYHIDRGDKDLPMPEYTLRYCDIKEMMTKYAKLKCKEQREICGNQLNEFSFDSKVVYDENYQDVINSPEPEI